MNYVDLDAVARRINRSFDEDGLLDIVIGLAALGAGFALATRTTWLWPLGWLPVILLPRARALITWPRLGVATPLAQRRAAERRLRTFIVAVSAALMVLGVATFKFAGMASAAVRLLRENLAVNCGILAGVLLALVGHLLGIRRFWAYAVLTPAAMILGTALDAPRGWSLLALGLVVTACGVAVLIRFLRAFPRREEEGTHAGT